MLITPDTRNHEWVNWEINLAAKLDKPIIGVWDLGSAGCELPEALDKYANAVVGWNGDRILAALDGERTFYNSDGSKTRTAAGQPGRLLTLAALRLRRSL